MAYKQVIVVRNDLRNKDGHKIRSGKLARQIAGASLNAFMAADHMLSNVGSWFYGQQVTIVLQCTGEQELFDLAYHCEQNNIPFHLMRDAGLTEFSEPTYTAIGIGPYWEDKIDKLTGGYSLL